MNIEFKTLGKNSMQCTSAGKTVVVFPTDGKAVSGSLVTLIANPEEQPSQGTISWPGEYDLENIAIKGVGHDEGKYVSYVIEMDDVRIAFIAQPLHDWSDNEFELLGEVDVLVLAAGDIKLAQKLIDDIDPRVLIPLPGKDQADYDELLKVIGSKNTTKVKDFKLKNLPIEGREVVVLN